MSHTTNNQIGRALAVLAELHNDPEISYLLVARDADRICRERYGIVSSQFARVPKDRRECYCHPVNLAQLAVEVAKKEVR